MARGRVAQVKVCTCDLKVPLPWPSSRPNELVTELATTMSWRPSLFWSPTPTQVGCAVEARRGGAAVIGLGEARLLAHLAGAHVAAAVEVEAAVALGQALAAEAAAAVDVGLVAVGHAVGAGGHGAGAGHAQLRRA